ncbi:MAG: hypothetical protein IM631_05045, partial [Cytophagales bacterium]|nr:hypothetical protein [Cytophagales bacterium]
RGSSNFNAATAVTQTLTVNKANQTITFNSLAPKTFGDAAFNLTATASSSLSVSYASSNPAVATVSGSTVTIIGAGSTVITASQSGSANYNAATDVTQTLTVNKTNQTITFSALSAKTFGDADFTLTATASSGLAPITYASSNTGVATVSGNTVTIVGAGSTTITASQSGNANYNAASEVAQTLIVNKANQTITFNALAAKTFGDANFDLTATASSGLTPTYTSSNTAVATVSGNTVTIVGAGSAVITASQSGDANYNSATNKTQTLTVNKANQTITFGPLASKTFIDLPFSLNATASSTLGVSYSSSNTSVATVNGSTITIVGVGSTLITASQSGDNNYNGATSVSQSLTVNKADQTIVFGAIGAKNQSDLPFQLSASSTSGLSITYMSSNLSVATVSGNTVTIVAPGTTEITASQAGNANFNAASNVVRSLLVNTKTTQTITFASLPNKVFGDPAFTLSATASSALPVSFSSSNPSVATVSGNTVTIVSAGTTNIIASQSGDNTFNNATDVIRSLVVNKANQTITFENLGQVSIIQGSVTLSATSSTGLPIVFSSSNNSVASVSGNTLTLNGIGSANITAEQAGNNNYNSATAISTIVVSAKLSQTIAFTPITDKIIGGSSFSLTATSSSNLPIVFSTESDKVSIAGNVVTILKAGRVVITATQAGDNIYNAASIDQSFCIAPAKLTITISNNFSDTPTLTSTAAANYQWYKNNILIPGATSQTLSVSEIGQYKVSTKADDCSATSDVFAIVVTANEPVLPNSDLPVEVFPNPADDYIHVHGTIGKFEYRLSSIIGSTIPFKLEKEGADYKGYVGSLPQGYYVLTIKQPTRTQSIKILKK